MKKLTLLFFLLTSPAFCAWILANNGIWWNSGTNQIYFGPFPPGVFTYTPTPTNSPTSTPTPNATTVISYMVPSNPTNQYPSNISWSGGKLALGTGYYSEPSGGGLFNNSLGFALSTDAYNNNYIDITNSNTIDLITGTNGSPGGVNIQANGSTSGSVVMSATGGITFNAPSIDVSSKKIHDVADPSAAQDASTKNYTDTSAGIWFAGTSTMTGGAATVTGLTGVTSSSVPMIMGQIGCTLTGFLKAQCGTGSVTFTSSQSGDNGTFYYHVKK